jgi:hypothetical protein
MKKFLMVSAAFALLTTTANAGKFGNVYTLYKGGYWETFGIAKNSEGQPMCGIWTGNDNQRLYIKWDGNHGTRLSVWKKDWNIDPDATVPFKVEFVDDSKPEDRRARAISVTEGWAVKTNGAPGTSVFMDIDNNDVPAVLEELSHASRINIHFPEGDEPTWHARGDGSKKAIVEFNRCISVARQAAGSSVTSPPSKSATSPVGKKPSSSPVKPAVKKDDGSV